MTPDRWKPTPSELEERFRAFIKSMGGERVDEVMPQQPQLPKNADFLLWNRTVVAELKIITVDHFNDPAIGKKYGKLIDGWIKRRLVVPRPSDKPGASPGAMLVSSDGLAYAEQRKAFDIMCAPIESAAASASRQIRATKYHLKVPDAKGLLILANLADRTLSPETVRNVLNRVLNKHLGNTIHSFAFFSPNVGVRLPDGEMAALWMDGFFKKEAQVPVDQMLLFSRGWHAFTQQSEI